MNTEADTDGDGKVCYAGKKKYKRWLEFVFYVKTDVFPLLEWCSFVQKVRLWYSKGFKLRQ